MHSLFWWPLAHGRRARAAAHALVLVSLGPGFALQAPPVNAASDPDRTAVMIETFIEWALEGRALPADPPQPEQALPHRDCGGRIDREHRPSVVFVAWQLSAEGQHAACNWKYDVASHRASPLTSAEAADVTGRISAGTIPPEERAFFHSTPQRDGRINVSAGYCWGSATGTFAFPSGRPVLVGELSVHGY